MAEDGYEVMGPTGGAAPIPAFPAATAGGAAPAAAPPPPPPPAAAPPPATGSKSDALKSKVETDTESTMGDKAKAKDSSTDVTKVGTPDSMMEGVEGDEVFQRPNGIDMCQVACVWFVLLIVVGTAIPVLLAATGTINIDSITPEVKTI